MLGYKESPDHKYAGWYEAPEDGEITVSLKKSGALEVHKIVVKDWDYITAQKLIDGFVVTGHYPLPTDQAEED